jgi:hypothetical protein
MKKYLENRLPFVVGELIRHMNEDEKLELAKQFSWEELEEWKATYETLIDRGLMHRVRQGLREEKIGKMRSAHKALAS